MGISDHGLVFAIRKMNAQCNNNAHTVITVRNIQKLDVNRFQTDLKNLPWGNVNGIENVNDQWELWKSMFLSVVDRHVPLKRKRIKNKPCPWLTFEIKKLLIKRDQLKRLAVKVNTQFNWNNYKNARNNCNNIINRAKSKYYRNIFRQNIGNSKVT